MCSQPSAIPRFSAAMDGSRTHSWRRCTPSSWRFTISDCTSGWAPAPLAVRERANAAAVVAVAPRKLRRDVWVMPASLQPASDHGRDFPEVDDQGLEHLRGDGLRTVGEGAVGIV